MSQFRVQKVEFQGRKVNVINFSVRLRVLLGFSFQARNDTHSSKLLHRLSAATGTRDAIVIEGQSRVNVSYLVSRIANRQLQELQTVITCEPHTAEHGNKL